MPMATRIALSTKDEMTAKAATHTIEHRDKCSSRPPDPTDSAGLNSQVTTDNPAVLCGMVRSLAMRAHSVIRRTSGETAVDPQAELVELLNHTLLVSRPNAS